MAENYQQAAYPYPAGTAVNPYEQYQQQYAYPAQQPMGFEPQPYAQLQYASQRDDRGGDRSSRRDRDKDRGKRSDVRERRRSRSRERRRSPTPPSPDPTKPYQRRRKTYFDVLPADMEAQPVPTPATATIGTLQRGTNQQATRHARQVYVGGLPATVTEQQIASFFSHALAAVGGNTAGPGESVVNVYINREKNFAFLEFRTVEECSNAMALDGIMFEGVAVRVRRPNDYNPQAAAVLGPSVPSPLLNLAAIGLQPGGMQNPDQGERIFVGGLPHTTSEEECRELLGSFGEIKQFDLVKDRETGNSKGYGFVVYMDPTVTNVAIEGLNGLAIGNRVLTVKRAADQTNQGRPAAPGGTAPSAVTSLSSATRILVLSDAIQISELQDDQEYEEIYEDMKDECSKYGFVKKIVIPRPPAHGLPPPPGLGKVVVEFLDPNDSVKARNALHGRLFGGQKVSAVFLKEELYNAGQYDAIGQ